MLSYNIQGADFVWAGETLLIKNHITFLAFTTFAIYNKV